MIIERNAQAPRYSLGKPRTGGVMRSKLTRYDVEEIRYWARTEGFGLSVADQVRILQETYTWVRPSTLADVLRNRSFSDLTYDPDVPLVQAPAVQSPVGWYLWLFAWVLSLALRQR